MSAQAAAQATTKATTKAPGKTAKVQARLWLFPLATL